MAYLQNLTIAMACLQLILRNVEYSILLVMSELSTVWCDRRTASRAVRKPRWEWRLGPRRGGGNLPVRGVLAVLVFSLVVFGHQGNYGLG